MLHDVGIAEQQKVERQGTDQSIIQPPTYLFCYTRIMQKDPYGGVVYYFNVSCYLCIYASLNFYLLCKISSLMLRHLATTSNTRRECACNSPWVIMGAKLYIPQSPVNTSKCPEVLAKGHLFTSSIVTEHVCANSILCRLKNSFLLSPFPCLLCCELVHPQYISCFE